MAVVCGASRNGVRCCALLRGSDVQTIDSNRRLCLAVAIWWPSRRRADRGTLATQPIKIMSAHGQPPRHPIRTRLSAGGGRPGSASPNQIVENRAGQHQHDKRGRSRRATSPDGSTLFAATIATRSIRANKIQFVGPWHDSSADLRFFGVRAQLLRCVSPPTGFKSERVDRLCPNSQSELLLLFVVRGNAITWPRSCSTEKALVLMS